MSLTLNQITSQVEKLAKAGRTPPAILLSGAPGVGKTHTGKYFAQLLKARVKYIDCSRWTKETTEEIREFCRTATSNLNFLLDETQQDMVFLDEIEQFGSGSAQLRGIMNEFGKSVFFFATTNYPDKLPEGVADRFIHAELSDDKSIRQEKLMEQLFSV